MALWGKWAWKEDRDKAGKEAGGKQKDLQVLEAQGPESQEGRAPKRPGVVGPESSALTTWWSLVILVKVMELRSDGEPMKRKSVNNTFEKFLGE